MFEFPPRRFIGNKAPTFVAQRKTLLEVRNNINNNINNYTVLRAS